MHRSGYTVIEVRWVSKQSQVKTSQVAFYAM